MSRLFELVRPRRSADDDRPPLAEQTWDRTVVGLHAFAAVLLTLSFVTALVDGGAHTGAAATAVAVLAVGYAVLGARAVAGCADGRAVAYLVLLVGCLGVVAWGDPGVLFLLTLAYPQVWFLVESPKPGIAWTLLLATAGTVGLAVGLAQTGGSPLSAIADMAVGLLFSIAMGVFMSRVMAQSRQRAALIAELERTRSELAAAHHAQGVTAERERLAREVHDTLAQGWLSVVVLAQGAAIEADPVKVRERLRLLEEVGRDNLAETRGIVAAFSPAALDGSTLVEALRRLADRYARETGGRVEVRAALPASVVLGTGEEVVLLRTAQEALSNVRRHAGRCAVVLSLTAEDGAVVVRVSDDGAGFDPATAGTGLAGLRARVTGAGGALHVESTPGAGTSLAARLPV